jgi:hypothetical protein
MKNIKTKYVWTTIIAVLFSIHLIAAINDTLFLNVKINNKSILLSELNCSLVNNIDTFGLKSFENKIELPKAFLCNEKYVTLIIVHKKSIFTIQDIPCFWLFQGEIHIELERLPIHRRRKARGCNYSVLISSGSYGSSGNIKRDRKARK